MIYWITVIILIILIILLLKKNNKSLENFGGYGALTQLYAKGPQDTYLTNNDYVYYPPPYMPHFIWNNPTRLYYRPYPLYGTFPIYYRPNPVWFYSGVTFK